MLKILYFLILVSLMLGQFVAIDLVPNVTVYLFDFLLLIFVTFGLFYFSVVKKSIFIPKVLIPFFLFSLICVVSLIVASTRYEKGELVIGSFYFIRYFLYLCSSVVVFNLLKTGMLKEETLEKYLVLSGILLALIGFVQLYLLPDFGVLDASLGWDPHKNRLASSFFDPNFAGQYLVMLLVILLTRNYQNKKLSPGDLLSFLLILVAVVLTFSRSAWAVLAIAILIIGFYRSKLLMYVSLIVFVCVYYAVPRVQTRISGVTDPSDSASLRITSWKNAWSLSKDNLFLGVGFNMYKYAQRDYGLVTIGEMKSHSSSGADSSLLFVLSTTGLVGLSIFITALLFPLLDLKKYRIQIAAVTLGLLVGSIFINSLFYPQIMFVYYALLARYSFSHI
jgi:O-antigen ligase